MESRGYLSNSYGPRVKENELLDAGSRANPQSINRVLGISGSSGLNSFSVEGGSGSYGGIWTSGHLHLYGENVVLYIQSPELTSFNSSLSRIEPERDIVFNYGMIQQSLFLSSQKAGLQDALTMRLAQIFQWDIDFVLDC